MAWYAPNTKNPTGTYRFTEKGDGYGFDMVLVQMDTGQLGL